MTQAFNIDCMEAMSQMKDNEYDLAIVDPPYGIGASGQMGGANPDRWSNPKLTEYHDGEWDKKPPPQIYFDELFRVSKDQMIWGANYFNLPPTPAIIAWDKIRSGNYAEFELCWTSFAMPSKIFKWLWNGFQKQKPEDRIHPTQKPVALYKWLLKNYAKEGDKILDTHLGSGSSRIAAHEMGYTFTGYEIDKDYFEAQEKRFANHIRQGNLFEAKEMY